MHRKGWLDRTLTSIAREVDNMITMMTTRDFWAAVAVGGTMVGFLAAAFVIMTNFDMMRMRNCFNASNLNAYLMFNVLMFFVFGGVLALGETFNYFDSKRRGVPHARGAIFWFLILTIALGSSGLVLLKISC